MLEVSKRLAQGTLGLILLFLLLVAPLWGLYVLLLLTGTLTLYNVAVAGGLYKEPLLAEFRRYGEEPKIYPLCNLLFSASLTSLSLSLIAPQLLVRGSFFARLLPSAVFVVLTVIFFVGGIVVYKQPTLRTSLPVWYHHLLRHASRQERRHLAWAWLRLPFKLRMRLNGDNKAFDVWAELVRLTVIYGAYDPNSPWHRWT